MRANADEWINESSNMMHVHVLDFLSETLEEFMVNSAFQTEISTKNSSLFHHGGRYHIKTSPLICRANQWAGFYMISASVVKELMRLGLKSNLSSYSNCCSLEASELYHKKVSQSLKLN